MKAHHDGIAITEKDEIIFHNKQIRNMFDAHEIYLKENSREANLLQRNDFEQDDF